MILAALPLLLAAQTVPQETVGDEIVVEAKAGLVTLVFDRRAGGGLANCRVLKGSGVKRIDASACADFLDCVSDDAKSACGNAAPEQLAAIRREMPDQGSRAADGSWRFTIPKLVEPEKRKIPAVGPIDNGGDDATSDQIVKLPPKPEDKTFSPAITISGSPQPCRNQEIPC